jgi:hypothetical protein
LDIISHKKIKDFVEEKYNIKLKNILIHDISIINYENFYDENINYFLYIVDIHNYFEFENNFNYTKYIKNGKLNFILCYAYFWNIYNNNFYPNRNIFFPHNVLYPCEINNNPINKILISGRGVKNFNRYPNRNKIWGLYLSKYNKIFIDHFSPHVSYRIEKNNISSDLVIRKNFIDHLNKYLVCFCDDGHSQQMPSIFAKFFEIMSSGSLLLSCNSTTKPYFEKLGFKDRIHYFSMTDDFMKDIKYVLDPVNREEVDRIRKAGYEQVWKYHSSEARAKELISMFNNGFDNYETYEDGINGTVYMCNKNYNLIFN